MPTQPLQVRPPVGQAVLDLLEHARGCLATAATSTSAADRYVAAHLAALRAGAAVIAARARRGGQRPRNVWVVLAEIAPELSEWAAFFAAGAGKRAAAEAELPRAVSAREADDLLREADAFLGLVTATLGLPYQPPLAGAAALHAS